MLEARVKESSKLKAITAFGGHQYNGVQWLPVPPESEDEAKSHPFLDVREVEEAEPEPEQPAAPKKTTRRRKRTSTAAKEGEDGDQPDRAAK